MWAAIIVVSQVIAVAKGFLPYKARAKSLASAMHEFHEHFVWAENKWFDVADGSLSEVSIISLRTDLQKRTLKTMKSYFPLTVLPDDANLLEKATTRADIYFANFYGGTK